MLGIGGLGVEGEEEVALVGVEFVREGEIAGADAIASGGQLGVEFGAGDEFRVGPGFLVGGFHIVSSLYMGGQTVTVDGQTVTVTGKIMTGFVAEALWAGEPGHWRNKWLSKCLGVNGIKDKAFCGLQQTNREA